MGDFGQGGAGLGCVVHIGVSAITISEVWDEADFGEFCSQEMFVKLFHRDLMRNYAELEGFEAFFDW